MTDPRTADPVPVPSRRDLVRADTTIRGAPWGDILQTVRASLALAEYVARDDVQDVLRWLVREDKGRGALRLHDHQIEVLRPLLTSHPEED